MRTVLLVEDSKFLRAATEQSLKKAGYLVVTAVDGMEALTVARESLPDLILLDMMLPKLDAPSVLRALKAEADSVTTQIPVVVVTALSQENEEKLMQDGAAAFLEKGLLLTSDGPLLDTLKQVLDS
jgi:CheY-like chemotaxis protein